MAADPLDDYIDAVARALALSVDDAWKPSVRANLEVSLRLARVLKSSHDHSSFEATQRRCTSKPATRQATACGVTG